MIKIVGTISGLGLYIIIKSGNIAKNSTNVIQLTMDVKDTNDFLYFRALSISLLPMHWPTTVTVVVDIEPPAHCITPKSEFKMAFIAIADVPMATTKVCIISFPPVKKRFSAANGTPRNNSFLIIFLLNRSACLKLKSSSLSIFIR